MVDDKRIKRCANPMCIIHNNKRKFLAIDKYCTVCQEELAVCCKRCGEIFESTGIDDKLCPACKKHKQDANPIKIMKNAAGAVGAVGVAADGIFFGAKIINGPAAKHIVKAVPKAGKAVEKLKPAAKAIIEINKQL